MIAETIMAFEQSSKIFSCLLLWNFVRNKNSGMLKSNKHSPALNKHQIHITNWVVKLLVSWRYFCMYILKTLHGIHNNLFNTDCPSNSSQIFELYAIFRLKNPNKYFFHIQYLPPEFNLLTSWAAIQSTDCYATLLPYLKSTLFKTVSSIPIYCSFSANVLLTELFS